MITIKANIYLVCLTMLAAQNGNAQSYTNKKIDGLYGLWKKRNYQIVYDSGKILRKSVIQDLNSDTKGANFSIGIPFLDYLILTSMCKIDSTKDNACSKYQYLLDYDLKEDIKKDLRNQFSSACGQNFDFSKVQPIFLSGFQ